MSDTLLIGSSEAPVSGELRLADIWQVVRQYYGVLLITSLLGIVLGVVADRCAPRLYKASATVELNKDSSSGLNLQDFSGSASQIGVGPDFMLDMLTEQAVLLSDNTALSVIEQIDIMKASPYRELAETPAGRESIRRYGPSLDQNPVLRDAALGIFKNGLKVTPVKNTRLIDISFVDSDPARAALVANTVVDVYLNNHTEQHYNATRKASGWLTAQLAALKQRAEETHQQVSDYEKAHGISGLTLATPDSKGEGAGTADSGLIAYQELASLSAELSRAEVNRIAKEAVYKLTSTGDPNVMLNVSNTGLASDSGGINALSSSNRDIQLVQSLRSQESNLKLRLAASKVSYGANNPVVLEMQEQIDSIHQQLQDEVGVIDKQARDDYMLARAHEDAMRGTVEEHQRSFATLGNSLAELSFLQQQENGTRVLYQDLYNRLEQANIAAGIKSSGVSMVDPARTPSRPFSPSLAKDALFGMAGGFCVGLLLAGIRKASDHSLRSPESIGAIWPYPMLGLIPHFAGAPGLLARLGPDRPGLPSGMAGRVADPLEPGKPVRPSGPWVVTEPKSWIAESYRQICASILIGDPHGTRRVLLCTSALAGDGKSVTAYNLASAFAKQAANVVLIEADMRRPCLAKIVGLDGSIGLSTLLAEDAPLDRVLQRHPQIENLSIITSGAIPAAPAEILTSDRFSDLLQTLRARFEYIIIDSPPALLVADSLLIARHVDAYIPIIRSGKLNKPVLNRLWTALAKPDKPVLGYVLNDYDPRKGNDGSYIYGKHGSYFQEAERL